MSHRSTLSRLALASLAAAVLAAAPASAMPADPQGATAQDPAQQDMHASTVQPADEAQTLDLRGEAATAGGGTGSTSGGPQREPRLQGPPTWPVNPTPLPRPTQQPVVVDGDDGGIDLDVPVALLLMAGTLALGGGMAIVAMKSRTRTAH
jgi:hypothetical protein